MRSNFIRTAFITATSLTLSACYFPGYSPFFGKQKNPKAGVCSARGDAKTLSVGPTLTYRRQGHTSTELLDGKVLVTGKARDCSEEFFSSTELFDPDTSSFTLAGTMTASRSYHTATRLQDGRVLLTGGQTENIGYLNSAEIYNPADGSFTATGSMKNRRILHYAVLLGNGKVLIVGGSGSVDYLPELELYDPDTGEFSVVASFEPNNWIPNAVELADGNALITGGGFMTKPNSVVTAANQFNPDDYAQKTAWIFEYETNTLRRISDMPVGRMSHSATLLNDGRVLLAGGIDNESLYDQNHFGFLGYYKRSATTIFFDPTSESFSMGPNLAVAHSHHTATKLLDGKVLFGGGLGNECEVNGRLEIFDPASNTIRSLGTSQSRRKYGTATLLKNGKVLLSGGQEDEGVAMRETEIFELTE